MIGGRRLTCCVTVSIIWQAGAGADSAAAGLEDLRGIYGIAIFSTCDEQSAVSLTAACNEETHSAIKCHELNVYKNELY